MSENRTGEWRRLKQSGVFKIEDRPGSITISGGLPFLPIRFWMAVLIYLPVAVFARFDTADGALATGVCWYFGAWFVWSLIWYLPLIAPFAYRVTFTPNDVILSGWGGIVGGVFPREALHQVKIEQQESRKWEFLTHAFVGDTGVRLAFPTRSRTKAVLRNNILMTAFAQPVHLDGVASSAYGVNQAPELELKPVVSPGVFGKA